MTPRQMIAFGELYSTAGRAGDRQVIPQVVDRSDASCRAAAHDGAAIANTATASGSASSPGHDSYYAWGYGGQFIFVIPDDGPRRRDDVALRCLPRAPRSS